MCDLKFEAARAEDADIIFALCRELIDTYEDLTAIDYDMVLSWVERKIRTRIGEYTCIRLGAQKAGFYRLSSDGDCMELDDLYILPPFRGQGLGTAVLKKCCAETSGPVFLYVFTGNRGAIRLYERMGFRITQSVGKTRSIMQRDAQRRKR